MIDLLRGVRVVESARLLNGDTLGMLLGQLGADVIKIEDPQRGDYLRDILGSITEHNSPAHLQFNSNKRSVAINLRSDEGLEVFWKLLATADVFVDGNVGGACDKLGIGYDEQRSRRPGIIYCQYTGFGVSGPYATVPAHGISMNALAGDTPVAMDDDGLMRPVAHDDLIPRFSPEATATGALWGAYIVAAALLKQRVSGHSDAVYIDLASSDAVAAMTGISNVYALNRHRMTGFDDLPKFEPGNEMKGARYQYYETSDGKAVIFGCIEPKFFEKFCVAVDRTDLIEGTDRGAIVHFDDDISLRRELQSIFHTRTSAEWMALAASHDIAIAPAPRSVAELRDDEHVRGRNLLLEREHPDAGPFTYLGVPAVITGQTFDVERHAPRLGQHTSEVLAEVGLDRSTIEQLRTVGAVR